MERLYLQVKPALSRSEVHDKNAWVTASKLCARKRPDLFPVRDRIVCEYLGLLKNGNYQVDWQVFRYLISQRDVRDAIDVLVDQALRLPGVQLGLVLQQDLGRSLLLEASSLGTTNRGRIVSVRPTRQT
jgi:Family of unknown function (DUF6308)